MIGAMTGDSGNQAEKLRETLLAARTEHDARCVQIEAGDAEPWVYEARDTAYAVAGQDNPADEVRQFVTSEIAEHKSAEAAVDGKALGESIGKRLRRVEEWRNGDGPLGFLKRPVFDSIRTDLLASRMPVIKVPEPKKIAPIRELDVAPIRAWRKATDERGERQTSALEQMLGVLERQERVGRLVLAATVIAAVAGTIAAVAAILGLFG